MALAGKEVREIEKGVWLVSNDTPHNLRFHVESNGKILSFTHEWGLDAVSEYHEELIQGPFSPLM